MIEQLKPWYSLDDIAEKVSELETYIHDSEDPLVEDKTVSEYLGALGRRVSGAGSRWSTGRRTKQERQDLEDGIDVYSQMLGALTLDLVTKTLEETDSVDKAKQAGLGLITESKLGIVTEDIRLRFEDSAFERLKRRLAHRPVERYAIPAALYGSAVLVTSAIVSKASEASSSVVGLTPAQGTAMFAAWAAAHRYATKSLPKQVGEQVKTRTNTEIDRYMSKNKYKLNGNGVKQPVDEFLPAHYAENHLEIPLYIIKGTMMDYTVDDRDDIEPMVAQVIQTAKELMYKSYDIELYEDDRPLYKRLLGRLALTS